MDYYVNVLEPLTAQQKEELTAYVRKLNNCKVFDTTPMNDAVAICYERLSMLDQGGDSHWEFSMPRYLAWNVSTAAAAFVVNLRPDVFALSNSSSLLAMAQYVTGFVTCLACPRKSAVKFWRYASGPANEIKGLR